MRNQFLLVILLPALLLLQGHRAKESDGFPHSPFHSAISAFTSGQISAASSFMVEFAATEGICC